LVSEGAELEPFIVGNSGAGLLLIGEIARYTASSRTHCPQFEGKQMSPVLDPAGEHIRVMEARIEQQSALLTSLEQNGQDTCDAVRRLNLLLAALDDMRLHLGRLAQTQMDAKNGRADILPIPRGKRSRSQ
jgi:hypothetical protein